MSPTLERSGVIAILRFRHQAPLLDIASALAEGGVRALEVTRDSPGGLDAIQGIRAALGSSVLVGVGTVRSAADVHEAVGAGAQFLVSPACDASLLAAVRHSDVPLVAGALTPSEIVAADSGGAAMVKVFPVASLGGPAYVRALRGPLPDVPLVPTGGVTLDTVRAYADAGAMAVAAGSQLVGGDGPEALTSADLRRRAAAFVAAWEGRE